MRLIADNLACERNGREIFREISFSVRSGEYLELRGPNGSGKSSLLRLVAGLLPIAQGTLKLEDGNGDQPLQQHCHYSGHQDAVKSALTVRENASFWARMYGSVEDDVALSEFSLQGLADHHAQILSTGQRRRLALTRLLLSPRHIWLLDEPATAIDATHREKLATLAVAHLARGGMVIAATHADWGLKPTRQLVLGEAS